MRGKREISALVSLSLCLAVLLLLPTATLQKPWRRYVFQNDTFETPTLSLSSSSPLFTSCTQPVAHPATPDAWDVRASALADVTGDGVPEWTLLVWRPWRDWAIQEWAPAPSPITGFHDAAGDSCHVILLDPAGREIWAGSALPAPFVDLAVGDVDGDGRNELLTLEGDYAAGREGPAAHVNIWRWNGFGFGLAHRSPPGNWREFCLTDTDNDGILDIAVR